MATTAFCSLLLAPDRVGRGCGDLRLDPTLVGAALDPEVTLLALHNDKQFRVIVLWWRCMASSHRHNRSRDTFTLLVLHKDKQFRHATLLVLHYC